MLTVFFCTFCGIKLLYEQAMRLVATQYFFTAWLQTYVGMVTMLPYTNYCTVCSIATKVTDWNFDWEVTHVTCILY